MSRSRISPTGGNDAANPAALASDPAAASAPASPPDSAVAAVAVGGLLSDLAQCEAMRTALDAIFSHTVPPGETRPAGAVSPAREAQRLAALGAALPALPPSMRPRIASRLARDTATLARGHEGMPMRALVEGGLLEAPAAITDAVIETLPRQNDRDWHALVRTLIVERPLVARGGETRLAKRLFRAIKANTRIGPADRRALLELLSELGPHRGHTLRSAEARKLQSDIRAAIEALPAADSSASTKATPLPQENGVRQLLGSLFAGIDDRGGAPPGQMDAADRLARALIAFDTFVVPPRGAARLPLTEKVKLRRALLAHVRALAPGQRVLALKQVIPNVTSGALLSDLLAVAEELDDEHRPPLIASIRARAAFAGADTGVPGPLPALAKRDEQPETTAIDTLRAPEAASAAKQGNRPDQITLAECDTLLHEAMTGPAAARADAFVAMAPVLLAPPWPLTDTSIRDEALRASWVKRIVAAIADLPDDAQHEVWSALAPASLRRYSTPQTLPIAQACLDLSAHAEPARQAAWVADLVAPGALLRVEHKHRAALASQIFDLVRALQPAHPNLVVDFAANVISRLPSGPQKAAWTRVIAFLNKSAPHYKRETMAKLTRTCPIPAHLRDIFRHTVGPFRPIEH